MLVVQPFLPLVYDLASCIVSIVLSVINVKFTLIYLFSNDILFLQPIEFNLNCFLTHLFLMFISYAQNFTINYCIYIYNLDSI
uniref:Uncharacterized protein n=1 Tax=Anguilla anguilla TaxID=7936 RepID=A0A0E9XTM4_ANGAN